MHGIAIWPNLVGRIDGLENRGHLKITITKLSSVLRFTVGTSLTLFYPSVSFVLSNAYSFQCNLSLHGKNDIPQAWQQL